jgi:hypothetical protein
MTEQAMKDIERITEEEKEKLKLIKVSQTHSDSTWYTIRYYERSDLIVTIPTYVPLTDLEKAKEVYNSNLDKYVTERVSKINSYIDEVIEV